ncbi:MAG: DUF5011 domain-containing protein [Bacilli bacterium]|nr:DUF5011 domain-containing protein [Bacilli bacterium]
MINRKRIFAIVLFVLIGLFVFTFANPNEDLNEVKDPDSHEKDNNNGEKEKDDEKAPQEETKKTEEEKNVVPVQQNVVTNYGTLQTAVNSTDSYEKIETEDEELVSLLNSLELEIKKAKTLLNTRNTTQANVNTQTTTISNLINSIDKKINTKLSNAITNSNKLLGNYSEDENLNNNLKDLLNQLQGIIGNEDELNKANVSNKLTSVNSIQNLLNDITKLEEEIEAINNAILTLDPSTTEWTNKDITLKLNVSNYDKDLIQNIEFKQGNTCEVEDEDTKPMSIFSLLEMVAKEITDEYSYVATENGNYVACVSFNHDIVKTVALSEGSIDNIDKLAPIIKLNYVNYSNHYRKAHARAATVTDDLSGFNTDSLKYVWTKNQNIDINDSSFATFENTKDLYTPKGETGTYYLVVVATDKAGNQEVVRTKGFNLDNEAPKNITITSNNENPINKDIILTVNAEDHGGIAGYQFNSGEWQTENFATFKKNQAVTVRVKDVAGNISDEVTYEITNIDKTKATINFGSTSGESSQNHNVTLSASDLSGIKQLRYQWLEASEGIESISIQTHLENNEEDPLIAVAPSNLNGTYYLWVYAQDNANNGIVSNAGPFVFDNERPEVIDFNQTYEAKEKGRIKVTIQFSEDVTGFTKSKSEWRSLGNNTYYNYYYRTKDISIDFSDAAGNLNTYNFIVDKTAPLAEKTFSNNNGNAVTPNDVIVTLTANEEIQDIEGWNRVNSKTFTRVFAENGKYSVDIKDLIGNPNTINFEVKRIDKVAPVINGVENNGLYNVDIEYEIIEKNVRNIIIDGVTYDEKTPRTGVVSEEGSHTITVTDKANHSTTVTFTIDKTAPNANQRIFRINATDHYATIGTRLYLKLSYTEQLSTFPVVTIAGVTIKEYTVSKDTSGNVYYAYYLTITEDVASNLKQNENIPFKVSGYKDIAGNEGKEYTTVSNRDYIIFDSIKPTITVKKESIGNEPYFSNISFKLFDENLKEADLNGTLLDKSSNSWGDINAVSTNKYFGKAGNNTLILRDKAGNETEYEFYLDNEAPVVNVIGNPTNLTNKDVVLTINATDNSGMLSESPYSFDGGTTWGTEKTASYADNQTVNIWVKDYVGNISKKEIVIDKIDRNVIEIIKIGGNTGNGSTLPIKGADNDIRLRVKTYTAGYKTSYVWTTSAEQPMDEEFVKSVNMNKEYNWVNANTSGNFFKRPITGIYYLWYKIEDAYGNELYYRTDSFNIDNTLPDVTISGNPENLTNKDVVLTINATDNSEMLAESPYSFDGGTTWGTKTTETYTENQTVNIWVKDFAGNINKKEIIIDKIDRDVIKITKVLNNGKVDPVMDSGQGGRPRITVNAKEGLNANAGIKYVWTTSAEQPEDSEFTIIINTDGSTNFVKYPKNIKEVISNPNGIYYLWFMIEDKVGNIIYYRTNSFNIDNTLPVINLKVSDGSYTYDYGKSTYVEHGATATDNADGEIEVTTEGGINDKVAGVYTITYKATDRAGNTATKERLVFIRPLVTAPENFEHELGEDFIAPQATVTISEDEKFFINPLPNRFNKDQKGDYKLEYQYVLSTEKGEIRSLGKNTIVSVVDTTVPTIKINDPIYTRGSNKKCGWLGCITIPFSDVDILVNVEDKDAISELKYIWSENPYWTPKEWAWKNLASTFENNTIFERRLLGDGILNWKLWIYAKDISGNTSIISSDIIHNNN